MNLRKTILCACLFLSCFLAVFSIYYIGNENRKMFREIKDVSAQGGRVLVICNGVVSEEILKVIDKMPESQKVEYAIALKNLNPIAIDTRIWDILKDASRNTNFSEEFRKNILKTMNLPAFEGANQR